MVIRYSLGYRFVAAFLLGFTLWADWYISASWHFWVLSLILVVAAVYQVFFFEIKSLPQGFQYRNSLGMKFQFDNSEIRCIADLNGGGFWIYVTRNHPTSMDRLCSKKALGRLLGILSLSPHPIQVPGKLKASSDFRELILSRMKMVHRA